VTDANRIVFVAFYTEGTRYQQEAARLQGSMLRANLRYDVRAVPDLGSWVANTKQTAGFILRMMDTYPDLPLVYLDADAYVWSQPSLFWSMDCDIAFHRRRGVELLNGTLYIAPTAKAREVIATYARLCNEQAEHRNEQALLDEALKVVAGVRVGELPASYCWIHDIMAKDIGNESPVIEHLQASREVNDTGAFYENRQRRLAEIAGNG